MQAADFEAKVQSFFATLDLGETRGIARARAYRSALAQAGLSGLSYPTELGGQGLDPEYERRFSAIAKDSVPGEAAMLGIGLGMALPTIATYGSPELQRRFIPPGLRGDEVWCQLFSEPGAGSDLAGLTCRAERDGDQWIVTGQKVWTSGAHHADLGILIARTDADRPKHRGVTMFVIEMNQPGVQVRPLVQMTGVAEFNEVFLDQAEIPADWVVGEVNGGWALAVALLAHERTTLGKGTKTDDKAKSKAGRSPLPYEGLAALAKAKGRTNDPLVRQSLAAIYTHELIIPALRAREIHPSVGKLWRTRQGRLAAQLAHELGGPNAVAWETTDTEADYWAYHVLNCRGMSLGGGTDEIQRNTIGERVLGLPREPGPPRDTPFRELPRN